MQGLDELIRVTKPGGTILIFIYSKAYQARQNFNQFLKIWIKILVMIYSNQPLIS